MLQYNEIRKHKQRFLALTGMTEKEFKALLPCFKTALEAKHSSKRTQTGKKRKRATGGGRKAILETLEDKLLFVLVYQKSYPVQELLAVTFGLSQPVANHWIHRLLPVVKIALTQLKMIPERKAKVLPSNQQISNVNPNLIIDGTERRIQRPQDKEEQKEHYSGKKKLIRIRT